MGMNGHYTESGRLNQLTGRGAEPDYVGGGDMQDSQMTLHGYVSGRVQGVFFRAETRRKAVELGVDGWVKNLDDGRVELLISGSPVLLERMRQWLRSGPPLARVDSLDLQPVERPVAPGFFVED